jgi:hypothetical protein
MDSCKRPGYRSIFLQRPDLTSKYWSASCLDGASPGRLRFWTDNFGSTCIEHERCVAEALRERELLRGERNVSRFGSGNVCVRSMSATGVKAVRRDVRHILGPNIGCYITVVESLAEYQSPPFLSPIP